MGAPGDVRVGGEDAPAAAPRAPTFEERFHLKRGGLHRRLWRDLRCAWFLAGMAWKNATIGRRVRRRYLAAKAAGEPFWLDRGNA